MQGERYSVVGEGDCAVEGDNLYDKQSFSSDEDGAKPHVGIVPQAGGFRV